MNKTYYTGLDVHKDSIAIAYTHEGSRQNATYYKTCGGSNLAAERALRSLAEKLGVKLQELKVCYEAGPTGLVLARRLIQLKVDCIVMAPSKTERRSNEAVKTDNRAERERLEERQPEGGRRRPPSSSMPGKSPASFAMAT